MKRRMRLCRRKKRHPCDCVRLARGMSAARRVGRRARERERGSKIEGGKEGETETQEREDRETEVDLIGIHWRLMKK